tara:strand:+ start:854 stop:1087 length:234 start_codon:yes stop_codon:yes gene_type:complete
MGEVANKVILKFRVGTQEVEQPVDRLISVDGVPFVPADAMAADFDEISRVLGAHEAQLHAIQQQMHAITTGLAQRSD